ncbi:MAG: hypothetical protein JNL12_00215 [Planctomycetes bacterium]|nr:hypothetical protein [Planctomycetota bacterium]
MNHDELASDPHERLVEVLLAEELGTARARSAPTRAAAARWLVAALLLLGLGVVFGVAILRAGDGDAPAATPAQEPESVVLTKHSEFLALAKDVVRVRMEVAKAWEPHFVAAEGAVAALEDAQQVQAFVAAVPKLEDGTWSFRTHPFSTPPDSARITLELRDGRVLRGGAVLREGELFWLSVLRPARLTPGPLLDQVNTLHSQALTNARIAHGITFSFAELARVPRNAQAIQCLPLRSGTVAQHLDRFPRLERVDQVLATSLGTNGPITELHAPARLAEFAVLPHLRHLRFAGRDVTDADVAELPTLRKLTSVRIDGGLGLLTERGHAALVSQLEALELVSVGNGNAIVRAAIAARRLQKLALFGVELTSAEFAELAALPTLRELDLTGIWWKDSHIAQLLAARTPLTRLRLRSTDITAEGLRTLAAMVTLRVLDLRREELRAPALTALQQALPECRILGPGDPAEDPWSLDEVPGRTRR